MAVQPFSHLGAPALASSMAPLKEKKPALVGADARRSLSLFLRSSRLDPTSPRRARRVPGWTSHPRTVDGRLVFHRFPLYQQMVFHFRDCFGECADLMLGYLLAASPLPKRLQLDRWEVPKQGLLAAGTLCHRTPAAGDRSFFSTLPPQSPLLHITPLLQQLVST